MPSLISHVAKPQALLDDLNYLNLQEIKAFCRKHGIPYLIQVEQSHGKRRKSAGSDRKGVILDRVRRYLASGAIPKPTLFAARVVCFDMPAKDPTKTDQLFYGQYDAKNVGMMTLLNHLTRGEFTDGAIARMLANEFWSKGVAPAYERYAKAWLKARRDHSSPKAEWAFLSDRASGKDTGDWKRLRSEKARQVLRVLNAIPVPKST